MQYQVRSSAISLDGYSSKIQKVSRCRPTVSNGTILATTQEFFLTKVAPVQSITHIVLQFLFISTAPLYFILHYHLFFRKEFIFLSNVYISVNTIFENCYKLTTGSSNLNAQHKALCLRDERKICYIY